MKKRILSIILAAAILVTMLPTTVFAADSVPFRDVASAAWYYDAVDYVFRNGIMLGDGNNSFLPEAALTRAQLCQILYNIEEKPRAGSGLFSDVSAGAWYSSAVNWAGEQGIVNGTGSGLFSPDLAISREQVVTILYRYAVYKNYPISDAVSLADYSDADLVSSWAEDAMQWAVSEGIITGTSAGTISPQGTATRAQAAVILMRFCRRMEAKQAFYAKNVDDFRGEEIINFDDSNETNFGVLVEDTVTAESSTTVNQLVFSDEAEGVYMFAHIDQRISTLESGDVLYLTYGSGADDYLLLKVGTIVIDGDTATITEGNAEISDYFQYIDVDMEIDLSGEDFGLEDTMSFREDTVMPVHFASASDVQPVAVSNMTSLPESVVFAKDISGSTSAGLKFGVKLDTVSLIADVKMTLKVKICYDKTLFDITEVSLSVEQKTKVEGEIFERFTEKEDTYKKETKPVSLPVAKGIDVEITAYFVFDVDASAGGSFSGTITSEEGVKFIDGEGHDIRESDADFSLDIVGDFDISLGFGVAGSIKVLKIFKISLSGEAGIELKGSAEKEILSSNAQEKHLCEACVDGEAAGYLELKLKIGVGISEKSSWTLVDYTFAKVKIDLGKFYISVLGGSSPVEFGWGECPHKQYLLTVVAMDQMGNRLAGVKVFLTDEETDTAPAPEGATRADGTYKVYCDNGSYRVTGYGPDGYKVASAAVTVDDKAATVTLELEAENAALRSEVTVDIYTGMPQIRYYNDKGQMVYCVMMDSGWDSGAYLQMAGGYWQGVFAVEFSYDANGNLLYSSGTGTTTSGEFIRCAFDGDLSYRYEGNEINAYDSDGVFRFAMDQNGNIVRERIYSIEQTAKYTYDSQGRVIAVKTASALGSSEAMVTYDVNGNVSAYKYSGTYAQAGEDRENDLMNVRTMKYTYEDGRMTQFDDSAFSLWPWIFSYDENGRIFLNIVDLDDGTHGGHYVEETVTYEGGWHSVYFQRNYRFEQELEKGTPSLSVWYCFDYWEDWEDYGYNAEEGTITLPSK